MRYIHIGYPKNLSTTLQRDFFDKHPEILHLGVGNGSNVDYIDDDINIACEEFFQYSKEYLYKENKEYIKKSFDKWFKYFESRHDLKAVGISLELLSFSWTSDHIDTPIKAKRVFDVFGSDTKIIMVIRNQFDLLKSLYREAIKLGYDGTYNEFIQYTYRFQDRNFLHDFLYHNVFETYSQYFGKDNIIVIPIENVRGNDGKLIKNENGEIKFVTKLCETLNVSYYDTEFGHYNAPLSDTGLIKMRKLNKEKRHNIGNPVFGIGTNAHRLKFYYNKFLDLNLQEDEIYMDVITKRDLISEAEKVNYAAEETIDYYFDTTINERLKRMFSLSNLKFGQMIDENLPEQYIL